MLVPADSPAKTPADMKGTRIGIAGGPVNKSWLIPRAYAMQQTGEDLAAVTVLIREGARALRSDRDDLALTFQVPFGTRLRHVILPQLALYVAGAARAEISLILKILLAVEFPGRSNGVGFQIHLNFQVFRAAHILACAFSFFMVMLAIEYLILKPRENHANRWTHDAD